MTRQTVGKSREELLLIMTDAIDAAFDAGNAILSIYNDPKSYFGIEKKADNSPLTIADKKAHEAICNKLNRTTFPMLSEEGLIKKYQERKAWNTLWIVDPLDGTKEFIKRNGEFTVNIALVSDGVPIGGVVYVPVLEVMYLGIAGIGAYKWTDVKTRHIVDVEKWLEMAQRLPLKERRDNEPYVVVASRSHMTTETQGYIDELRRSYADVEMVSRGSSLKLCMVAEGYADEYPRFAPTMEWDTAAGDAVVRAAGGSVCGLEGEQLSYNKENLLNPWFIVSRRSKE